jgi:hypothetical protein
MPFQPSGIPSADPLFVPVNRATVSRIKRQQDLPLLLLLLLPPPPPQPTVIVYSARSTPEQTTFRY